MKWKIQRKNAITIDQKEEEQEKKCKHCDDNKRVRKRNWKAATVF